MTQGTERRNKVRRHLACERKRKRIKINPLNLRTTKITAQLTNTQ